MDSLYLAATENTPELTFDVENSKLFIEGVSEIESSSPFYPSITEYLNRIEANKPLRLKVELHFEKLCRNSKRGLLFFLIRLKDLERNCGTQLVIDWITGSENELVKSIGVNLEYMVRLKINFIEIDESAVEETPEVELAY